MTPIAKLTKNMMISELMRETGWSRKRVVNALEFLEAEKTICIADNGSLSLRMF